MAKIGENWRIGENSQKLENCENMGENWRKLGKLYSKFSRVAEEWRMFQIQIHENWPKFQKTALFTCAVLLQLG
jgi:hypothetical protein